jgi:uncharacterized protein (TIGR02118 family)
VIKLYGLIPKRTDISDEQFHAHWASTHKELALRIRALRQYVQSHRVRGEVASLPSSIYEGIAEVWLDDVGAAVGLAEDPDYTENAKLDEPNFIDVDRHGVIVAREHVIDAGPPIAKDAPGVKAMLLLRRRAGAFTAPPTRLADGLAGAERIVLAVPLDESYADGATPPYDAVLEAWFADADAFERAWASTGDVVLDELDADRSASSAVLVEELRVIWPEA